MWQDEKSLHQIADATTRILRFVSGYKKAGFLEDEKTQSAVNYQIVIIGEAVKKLSEDFRQTHSELPWRQIAGMRDILVHRAHVINIEEIWNVVSRDVPYLIQWLRPHLQRQ